MREDIVRHLTRKETNTSSRYISFYKESCGQKDRYVNVLFVGENRRNSGEYAADYEYRRSRSYETVEYEVVRELIIEEKEFVVFL